MLISRDEDGKITEGKFTGKNAVKPDTVSMKTSSKPKGVQCRGKMAKRDGPSPLGCGRQYAGNDFKAILIQNKFVGSMRR